MSDYFKGVTFPWQEVTPSDDAIVRRAILPDRCLSGCELTYSGYTLTMAAGSMIVCGRQFKHTAAQNWAITGATSGYARLLLEIDVTKASTEDAFEQIATSIEYASAVDGFSVLRQDNINSTGTIYQVDICVVALGTGGITRIVSSLTKGDLAASDVGAAEASHNHAATAITSGLLSLERGGAGVNLYNSTKDKPFGILRLSSDPDKYPFVFIEPTANGAFFATADNTDPKFGTLPIPQGGTNATTAADALANLGALPLAGGTMTGALNMGTNSISYLADPTGPMQAANKRYVDNSVSTSVSSASNNYHTAHFAKIGKLVICTLLPIVANTTAIYQEDITMPTGYYPAVNTTFTIYTTLDGGGNAEVRAYANGILRVMRADGVSLAESSKTYCWVTA